MFINKTKTVFSLLGVGLTAGSIALFNNDSLKEGKFKEPEINRKGEVIKLKLRKKYKNSLIEDGHIWGYRLKDLKNGSPENPELLKIKDLEDNVGILKIQEVCQKIIDSDEGTEWFEDFQKFCVMKNKDESNLINDKNRFSSKYDIFSKAEVNRLSKGFLLIWENKGNQISDEWKEKMLNECKKLQEKMFVGDAEYFDFEKYCTLN